MKQVHIHFDIEINDDKIILIKNENAISLGHDEAYLLAHWVKEYLKE